MNSTEALREFAETIYANLLPIVKWDKERDVQGIMDMVTALISEHYYPKEFTTWLVFGSHPFCEWFDDDGWYFTDELSDKRWSIDELFNYWKENEQ